MSQLDLKFERAVDELAESLVKEVRHLAKECAKAFPDKKMRVQVSHIEQQGRSSRRFNDLIAFAMRQTGKAKQSDIKNNHGWLADYGAGPFGKQMVTFLEELKGAADRRLRSDELSETRQNELRLRVAAVCLRNIHSAYLYHLLPEVQ